MKSTARLLLILVFSGLIPLSCDRCNSANCECEDFGSVKNFTITEFGIKTVNPGTHDPVEDTLFYTPDSIAKSIYIAEKQMVATSSVPVQPFSFSSPAFACSPVEPRSTEAVVAIEITAGKDFFYHHASDTVRQGDDISSMFLIGYRWSAFTGIADFLQENGYLSSWAELYLKLAEPPYAPVKPVFNLKLTMSDGRIFVFEDQEMRVK